MEEQTEITSARPLALAIKNDPDVIQRILVRSLNGEKLRDIAPEYGVSKQALQQQIIKYAPDDWRDTQAARSMVAYEEARDRLEEPLDVVDIARVREQVRARQWELERLIPRLYGQKQEVTVTHRSDLAERIQAAERRIIDVTPETVPPLSK
jgi:Zn-dependent peptidase ImmA (M78 family)